METLRPTAGSATALALGPSEHRHGTASEACPTALRASACYCCWEVRFVSRVMQPATVSTPIVPMAMIGTRPMSPSCRPECTETFWEGRVQGFGFFGGVPTQITYDNTKVAVAQILGGGLERRLTTGFLQLKSHYLFNHHFCNVGRGNEKGVVEGLVGVTHPEGCARPGLASASRACRFASSSRPCVRGALARCGYPFRFPTSVWQRNGAIRAA